MGEDYQENVPRFLREWRSLTLKQGQALSEGNLELFEQLTNVWTMFQERFDAFLSKRRPKNLDQTSLGLLKEIRAHHSDILAELEKGRKELSDEIASLRTSKASLHGYGQSKSPSPGFMSRRT